MSYADPEAGPGRRPHPGRFALPLGLVLAELLALSLLYQHDFTFTCRAAAPTAFCAFAGRIVPRALAVLAALLLFALARGPALRLLFAAPLRARGGALALQLAGFALVLAPWLYVTDASSSGAVLAGIACWSVGGLLAAGGTAGLIAPATAWRALMAAQGPVLACLAGLALALPEITDLLRPLWRVEAVTEASFSTVVWLLERLGYAVQTDLAEKAIGIGSFAVRVGSQCSGVEGFALISLFLTLYFVLFRHELRFPRVLVLLPLGLAASWIFNAVRITTLLVIGAEVSPELAVGSFHSHAGWLSFLLLSLGLIAVSRTIPAFRREGAGPRAALPPFFRDPAAAALVPFAAFMASGLLATTFIHAPALAYPARALVMALALAPFWPVYRALPWRPDPLALAAGVAIGVAWVATTAPALPSPEAAPGPLWIAARIAGTALLVPLIEEMVFRGYLLGRIAPAGASPWRVLAGVAISTALFAALHDRWLAAAVSGLVFAGLALRRGDITGAVQAHMAANATIAAWALATGAWHAI